MRTAKRISRLSEPSHRKILKEASKRGGRIMNLSVGDIFIDPHPLIKEAVKKASEESRITYPPVEGFGELRESIAKYLRESRRLEVSGENVLVTAGASEAFLIALFTVLDVWDRIILPNPTYPQHELAVNLFDNVLVDYYNQDEDVSEQIAEKGILERGKDIVLVCSPNNPTGRIIKAKDVERLMEHIDGGNSIVVSDETYFEIPLGGNKSTSPGTYDAKLEKTILVSSFSKNMGITGLRVGFLAADKDIVGKASMVRYATSLTSNIMGQKVVIQALPFIGEISSYVRSAVKGRLKAFLNGFRRMELLKVYEPDGSLYIFPEIPYKSFDFCLELAKETGVVLAPGWGFGPSGEHHVRISFGAMEEDIRDSIEIINAFEPKVERRL